MIICVQGSEPDVMSVVGMPNRNNANMPSKDLDNLRENRRAFLDFDGACSFKQINLR